MPSSMVPVDLPTPRSSHRRTVIPCRVTERTWDKRPRWILKPAELSTGVSDRTGANAEHIRLTLQRLKERAEAG